MRRKIVNEVCLGDGRTRNWNGNVDEKIEEKVAI